MDIGHRIYEIRKKNNMSQEQFAELFHVTRQTVSNWENNRNYPDMNTLKEISDRFDVSFDYLLKEDEELMDQIDNTRKNASLRKKIIILLSILMLAVLAFLAVPKIIDHMYYNPQDVISSEGTKETYRFETDMNVYRELYVPGRELDNVNIQKTGNAKYSVRLSPGSWVGDQEPESVTGQIDKGKIFWYNPDGMDLPTSNIFEWTAGERNLQKRLTDLLEEEGTDKDISGFAGSPEDSRESIENLIEGKYYQGYVSFDKVMTYEAAMKWIDHTESFYPWIAIATDKEYNSPIGMYANFYGSILHWDNDRYPNLIWYLDNDGKYITDQNHSGKLAKERFISMLTYMKDQEEFLSAMYNDEHVDGMYYDDMISFVKENGIIVYGVSIVAQKEEFQKLMEDQKVYSIAIEEY